MTLNTSFPQNNNKFLKASDFQDRPTTLTYKGWKKKANDDDPLDKPKRKTWIEKLDYMLRYSYPEWAIDTRTGEKRLSNGKPFKNANWDPEYPKGYSVVYVFEQGELESGSLPLFAAFCSVAPQPGEKLTILRTGKDKETVWSVTKANGSVHKEDLPSIDFDDPAFSGDPEAHKDDIPF